MRSELVNAALRVAWQQWTALGVSGTVAPPDHAIDLEALLLFTPVLRHDDPRLYDEALDWCVHHAHRLVSIARLRRLRAALPDEAREAYDHFAAIVNATATPRLAWPTDHTGAKIRTSGKSQAPDIRHRALLQLRLRCLFGVTARADVLLRFLRPIMVQEISPTMTLTVSTFADLGYSKPAIAEVLNDLTMAGLVERWRRGNRDYYELTHVGALEALVGGALPATAPSWTIRLRVIASLLSAEAATHEKKPVVQAVAILKQLEQHHDALERLGVKPPAHAQTWPDLASWARHALLDERESTVDDPKTARWRWRKDARG
jgi:DNA-binding transcriptional ArsR family regulator